MDELLKALQAGQLHSTGSFSLDSQAAIRRFRDYALEDPLGFVARLLRVAVLCHAPSANVLMGRGVSVVQFPAHSIPLDKVEHVFDQVLSGEPWEREFAIAVNSLLARPFQELTITLAEGPRVVQLKMTPDGQMQTREAYDLSLTGSLTHFQILHETPRADPLPELFRFAPLALTVNGRLVQVPFGRPGERGLFRRVPPEHAVEFRLSAPNPAWNGIALPNSTARQLFRVRSEDGSHVFLVLAVRTDVSAPREVVWIYRGQVVEVTPERFFLPGVRAVVGCEGLPFDITGEKPIHGRAYEARRQLIRDWLDCLSDYLETLPPWLRDQPLPRLLPLSERVRELLQRLPVAPKRDAPS